MRPERNTRSAAWKVIAFSILATLIPTLVALSILHTREDTAIPGASILEPGSKPESASGTRSDPPLHTGPSLKSREEASPQPASSAEEALSLLTSMLAAAKARDPHQALDLAEKVRATGAIGLTAARRTWAVVSDDWLEDSAADTLLAQCVAFIHSGVDDAECLDWCLAPLRAAWQRQELTPDRGDALAAIEHGHYPGIPGDELNARDARQVALLCELISKRGGAMSQQLLALCMEYVNARHLRENPDPWISALWSSPAISAAGEQVATVAASMMSCDRFCRPLRAQLFRHHMRVAERLTEVLSKIDSRANDASRGSRLSEYFKAHGVLADDLTATATWLVIQLGLNGATDTLRYAVIKAAEVEGKGPLAYASAIAALTETPASTDVSLVVLAVLRSLSLSLRPIESNESRHIGPDLTAGQAQRLRFALLGDPSKPAKPRSEGYGSWNRRYRIAGNLLILAEVKHSADWALRTIGAQIAEIQSDEMVVFAGVIGTAVSRLCGVYAAGEFAGAISALDALVGSVAPKLSRHFVNFRPSASYSEAEIADAQATFEFAMSVAKALKYCGYTDSAIPLSRESYILLVNLLFTMGKATAGYQLLSPSHIQELKQLAPWLD